MSTTISMMTVLRILWLRGILRFFRQPRRALLALVFPLVLWVVLSFLLISEALPERSSLLLPGYFFPASLLATGILASLMAAAETISERHGGFLQAVLAGPSLRPGVLLGEGLAIGTNVLVAMLLFLFLLPASTLSLATLDWGLLLLSLVVIAFSLGFFGVAMAWVFSSEESFLSVSASIFIPLWLFAGALFPILDIHPALHTVAWLNPLFYALLSLDNIFFEASALPLSMLALSPYLALALFAALAVGFSFLISRIPSRQ